MISDVLRERYLRDSLPLRLGGLAADLARVSSFADSAGNKQAVASILEEGKWFAEWAAPDAPIEVQEILAEVQILIAFWHRRWLSGHPEPNMCDQARRWSNQLLKLSGLAR